MFFRYKAASDEQKCNRNVKKSIVVRKKNYKCQLLLTKCNCKSFVAMIGDFLKNIVVQNL